MDNTTRRDFLRVGAAATLGTGSTTVAGTVGASSISSDDTIELDAGTVKYIFPDEEDDFNLPYKLTLPDYSVKRTTKRPIFVRESQRGPENEPGSIEELISLSKQSPLLYLESYMLEILELPTLVPLFPSAPNDQSEEVNALQLPSYREDDREENWEGWTLDSIVEGSEFAEEDLTRVDRQLVAMIDDAKNRLNSEPYEVTEGVHMYGFSAGSTFASRFAFLHPSYVDAYAAGGSAVLPLPMDTYETEDGEEYNIPYPVGTDDYEKLTGGEFDNEEWKSIDKFIFIGNEDNPKGDGLPTGSPTDPELVGKVHGTSRRSRFNTVRDVYNSTNTNATFQIYEGVGHSINAAMDDGLKQFFDDNTKIVKIGEYNPGNQYDRSEDQEKNSTDTQIEDTGEDGGEPKTNNTQETSNDSTPGFGITGGLATIGATSYLLKQRLTSNSD